MNRGKKLLINLCIIVCVLLLRYYFGGYYISQEQCLLETMRGLYAKETDIIMELETDNHIKTLVADFENRTVSIIGTKKKGIFYQTASSSIGSYISDKEKIHISAMGDADVGMAVFIYRNDKNIHKVEVKMEDGKVFQLDEWNQDFTGFLYECQDWKQGEYILLDQNNNIIGKIVY